MGPNDSYQFPNWRSGGSKESRHDVAVVSWGMVHLVVHVYDDICNDFSSYDTSNNSSDNKSSSSSSSYINIKKYYCGDIRRRK